MIERPSGAIQTSVLVSKSFYDAAKANNIKFSEALRVGISILLADKGITEYDNNLNLYRKMKLFQQEASTAMQKLAEVEARLNAKL